MAHGYTYLWEFQVRPDLIAEFERHYGANGTWAALFRKADGYIETLLLRDRSVAGRYVTVDRWQSEQAYESFQETFGREYAALDRACEGLAMSEVSLGTFEV